MNNIMDDNQAAEMFYRDNPSAVKPNVLPETMTDDQAASLYEQEKQTQPVDFTSIPNELSDNEAAQYYQRAKKYGEKQTAQSTATTGSKYNGNIGNQMRPTKLPIEGRISQEYGVPVDYEASGKHGGIDIAVPVGTPIPEVAGGEVIESRNAGNWGNTVLVRGTDGITRRYSHLSKLNYKDGDIIKAGDVVGLSGNTGYSTGPHLDYREYQGK